MVFGFGKKEQIIEKEVMKEVYRTPEKKKAQKIGIIVG
ncbi:TPA: NADPH-dependent oxidoreductase, partial [Enterococcus faecium]|nr:NADPH-dependent oxidoreductase [Enterococcus faecium]